MNISETELNIEICYFLGWQDIGCDIEMGWVGIPPNKSIGTPYQKLPNYLEKLKDFEKINPLSHH